MTSRATTAAATHGVMVQQRQPTQAQHEQDLLGRVRVRGQRVAAEHRQGELLRKEGVAHHRGLEGVPQHQALG